MHTTIGIGNKIWQMLLVLTIVACNGKSPDGGSNDAGTSTNVVSPVKVTTIDHRDLQEVERVPATVVYIDKSNITAPVTGFLTEFSVQTGSTVQRGDALFTIETKEHRALQNDTSLPGDIANYGIIRGKAQADGYIASTAKQQGDYVQEGAAICAFTRSDKALIKAFVPFSSRQNLTTGKIVRLVLPDGSTVNGKIVKSLNLLDQQSQNIQVLVKPASQGPWPEGLNLFVTLSSSQKHHAQVLPKKAILSNERLTSYWVMKLKNDSTAVKVPVKTGLKVHDSVQVVKPKFEPGTCIITAGGYGLPDTAKVVVPK